MLIQPNLRFFHELFGWEVELARREQEEEEAEAAKAQATSGKGHSVHKSTAAAIAGPNLTAASCTIAGKRGARRIMYSWPAFCRDLVSAWFCLFYAALMRVRRSRVDILDLALPQQAFPVQLGRWLRRDCPSVHVWMNKSGRRGED